MENGTTLKIYRDGVFIHNPADMIMSLSAVNKLINKNMKTLQQYAVITQKLKDDNWVDEKLQEISDFFLIEERVKDSLEQKLITKYHEDSASYRIKVMWRGF